MNFIENIVENQSSTIKEYEEDYEKSIDNPDAFWKEKAESLVNDFLFNLKYFMFNNYLLFSGE